MTLAQLDVEDVKRSSKQEHKFLSRILLVAVGVRRDLLLQFQEQVAGDHSDHLPAHELLPPSKSLVIWDSEDSEINICHVKTKQSIERTS